MDCNSSIIGLVGDLCKIIVVIGICLKVDQVDQATLNRDKLTLVKVVVEVHIDQTVHDHVQFRSELKKERCVETQKVS